MSSIVESLRASRKNPSVLKLKILKVRGQDPDVLIFCYEGVEDVPVYEEWMRRIAGCPRYEAVPGAGKYQLVALHTLLAASDDPLLDKTFFFVDRDFDLQLAASEHLYELDAYSIENVLCTDDVLESILRDEFKRTGTPLERSRVREKFQEMRQLFFSCAMPINFALFSAIRTNAKILRKPEKVTEIVNIAVSSITPAYVHVGDILEIQPPVSAEALVPLQAEFDSLHIVFKERGKYLLDMFRRWLKVLAEDLKSPMPTMFDSQDAALGGDASSLPLRRFAAVVPVPTSLSTFMENAIISKLPMR